MPSGHLVADLQLAPLGDGHPHLLLHAGRQIVGLFAGEDAHIDDGAVDAVRDTQRGVFHLARLLAEDRAQQLLFGGQLGLALGRNFADQNVAGVDLGADSHDALGVEVSQRFLGHVRDVAGDLLVAELGFARADLVLGHVDRGELVVLHEPLGDDHRVLKVVALPGHERGQHVLAQRQLAVVGRGRVGDRLAERYAVAAADNRPLVDAGALVGAQELDQRIADLAAPPVVADRDRFGGDGGNLAVAFGDQHLAGVEGRRALHTGADQRHLGAHQRHGLALHVRAHQRAVGVVVLEERNQARRDRHDLARRDVHVVDLARMEFVKLLTAAPLDALLKEVAVGVDQGVGLGDDRFALVVGGQLDHLVGNVGANGDGGVVDRGDSLGQLGADRVACLGERFAVRVFQVLAQLPPDQVGVIGRQLADHAAVGSLDEAVLVEHAEGGQTADQPDVGAFGRFDRADPPVVAVVHIAHVEACPVAAEPAGAQGGEAALVRQLGQRVGLIHELAQLVAAEELFHRGLDGADVDQRAGGRLIRIDDRHPLADHALHAGHADAELALQLLAHRADAPVAEVVNIVGQLALVVDRNLSVDHGEQVAQPERAAARFVGAAPLGVEPQRLGALGQGGVDLAQPLVDLVAPHAAQVVAAGVEELAVEQRAGGLDGGRVAGAEAFVELFHRPRFVALFGLLAGRLLGQRRLHKLVHGAVVVRALEHLQNALVGAQPRVDFGRASPARAAFLEPGQLGVVQRPQQGGDRDLALAVHLDREQVAVAGLELQPGPAVGDQLGGAERAAGGRIGVGPEIDARRTHQLGDDHALRAVDDEGARLRHVRQVAEVEPLLLALAALLGDQLDADLEPPGVGRIAAAALVWSLLGRQVAVVLERELHPVAGEILDRRHLDEQLAQSHLEEPLVGIAQQLNQVRQIVRLGQARVVDRLQRSENHGDSLRGRRGPAGLRGAQRDGRRRAEWAQRERRAERGGETAAGRRLRQGNPRRSVRSVARRRGAGARSPNAGGCRTWMVRKS